MTVKTSHCALKAHKAVFCSLSSVIARAFEGGFLVKFLTQGKARNAFGRVTKLMKRIQEAHENCYYLSIERYEVPSRFVQYCYLSLYDDIPPSSESQALFDIQVFHDCEEGIIGLCPSSKAFHYASLGSIGRTEEDRRGFEYYFIRPGGPASEEARQLNCHRLSLEDYGG